MNLVLGLLVLGGSSLAVWAGITDPEGGMLAGVRNVMAGAPNVKHTSATAAAFVASIVPTGSAGSAGSNGAGGTPPAGPGDLTEPGSSSAPSGAAGTVLAEARSWLGVPYKWGGTTRAGVDCSGFTRACFARVGVSLPRVSAAQQTAGRSVFPSQRQPGNLVFFGYPAHHVGIYVGGNSIIHAPHSGTVVRIEEIWRGDVVTYRDVLGATSSTSSTRRTRRKGTAT